MRVLAIDPGAERCGWAVLLSGEEEPLYVASGIQAYPRGTDEFQEYKMALIDHYVTWFKSRVQWEDPDVIVTEIVPAVGGGNFTVAAQSHLAHTQITVIHALANLHGYPVVQIGATTVKARIGGGKSASKVKVRDGVFDVMPWAAHHKKESWKEMFRKREYDECDAFAIALTHLGYDRRPIGRR